MNHVSIETQQSCLGANKVSSRSITLLQRTTTFMLFSVTYTICAWPKLDAQRSQSATSTNRQYDTIHQPR